MRRGEFGAVWARPVARSGPDRREVGGPSRAALPVLDRLVNFQQALGGSGGGELDTAFGLAGGTHFQAGLLGLGDREHALDEALDIAGGVDEAGFSMVNVLGLAAFRSGDDWQADDARFLDAVRRGVGAGGVDEAPGTGHPFADFGGRAVAEQVDVGGEGRACEFGVAAAEND